MVIGDLVVVEEFEGDPARQPFPLGESRALGGAEAIGDAIAGGDIAPQGRPARRILDLRPHEVWPGDIDRRRIENGGRTRVILLLAPAAGELVDEPGIALQRLGHGAHQVRRRGIALPERDARLGQGAMPIVDEGHDLARRRLVVIPKDAIELRQIVRGPEIAGELGVEGFLVLVAVEVLVAPGRAQHVRRIDPLSLLDQGTGQGGRAIGGLRRAAVEPGLDGLGRHVGGDVPLRHGLQRDLIGPIGIGLHEGADLLEGVPDARSDQVEPLDHLGRQGILGHAGELVGLVPLALLDRFEGHAVDRLVAGRQHFGAGRARRDERPRWPPAAGMPIFAECARGVPRFCR